MRRIAIGKSAFFPKIRMFPHFSSKMGRKYARPVIWRRSPNASGRFFLASLRQNDRVGRKTRGYVDIFIGKPVYKILEVAWSSSRCSGKVRVGFAGSAVTEKAHTFVVASRGAATERETSAVARRRTFGFAGTRQWRNACVKPVCRETIPLSNGAAERGEHSPA